MMKIKTLPFALSFWIILLVSHISAQDNIMVEHKWQKRIICIVADNATDSLYKYQIAELTEDVKGLEERKLMIYDIHKDKYRILFPKESASQWAYSNDIYQKYTESEASFNLLLIGLDGGIKLRQQDFLTTKELFRIIDSMPMRRAEIRDGRY